MKILKTFGVSVFMLALVVGCQKEAQNQSFKGMALIQAADGTLYSADCIADQGVAAMDTCRMQTSQGSQRGFHSSSWWSPWYSNNYSYYNWAYVLEPSSNTCSYYFGYGSCWNWFGWNNNSWSNYWTDDLGLSRSCYSGCSFADDYDRCRKRCGNQWNNFWNF